MVVFATNIGSSATVVGNPIGVLIALRSGLSFPDFFAGRHLFRRGAGRDDGAVVLVFPQAHGPICRQAIEQSCATGESRAAGEDGREPALSVPAVRRHHRGASCSTTTLEKSLGLGQNVLLVGVAMLAAGIVLFIERQRAKGLVEARVDWWTLAFFMLLFASAGTLRYVGVTEHIAAGHD